MSPRNAHAYQPLSLKRRAWLTVGAVVLGGAGVVTYAVANPSEGPGGGKARAASVHALKLQTQGAGRKGLGQRETDQFSAVMLTWPNPDTKLNGTAQTRSRDLTTGTWSPWQSLPDDPYSADGKEATRAGGALGGTASVWTGPSDGVEVRVVAADGSASAKLPDGMDVKLLDPGTDPQQASGKQPLAAQVASYAEETTPAATPSDSPTPTDTASASANPTPTDTASASASPSTTVSASPSPSPTETVPAPRPSTVVKPPVISQAEWGASTDYDGTPSYGQEIKAAVVHHTGVDSDNGVSCAESRGRMRTIQQEHFARGYYDVGYNFVVDRCGQIFEGRSGGMDLPVVGAHDVGFNTNTLGVSYIGNTEKMQPTKAGVDAIARVIAWKFGMYGISPTSSVTLTSGAAKDDQGNNIPLGTSITLPRVFGHFNTNATACPGAGLKAKLKRIATLAATPGISHALATSDGLSGAVKGADGKVNQGRDGVTDLAVGVPKAVNGAGSVTVLPSTVDGPTSTGRRTFDQNSAGIPGGNEAGDNFGASNTWGDVNGDGYADLITGSPGEDGTSAEADSGTVTVVYGPGLNSGKGYVTSPRVTGEKLGTTVATGDFNADGKSDIFSVAPGKPGRWWAWDAKTATAKSGYLNTSAYTGAVAYAAAATGDFNMDGYADVAVNYRDPSGVARLLVLKGSPTGLVRFGILATRGGRTLATGDLNGDGYTDLAIGQPGSTESGTTAKGGAVTTLLGSATGLTATGRKTISQDTGAVPGSGETGDDMGASISIGDVNLDGYADVVTGLPNEDLTRSGVNQANAGQILVLRGSATGLTDAGSAAYSQETTGVPGSAETGDRLGSSVSLTDLSGYGRADLAIGVDGEDAGNGTILQIDTSSTTGITPSTGVFYGTSALGLPAGLHIGQTLAP
ncbi:FG-GAP-like repeat-containing protein [Streptomyces sp. NBC_01465]|uniref:FG-GAP-like repeat-containing protein n=1 Tax=Streptomyces sp. NBC_01465 TaxID=2903878 RepID=UPI002E335899|nr:N-acetylmuramoyl-L-alanine amidase [Streptomyces sp. NBC_01465]